jgi:hypothetical protein
MTVPIDKILEIASHIFEPIPASTFAVGSLLVLLLFNRLVKLKTNFPTRRAINGIIALGFAPLLVYLVIAFRGVYRVQVTVLDLNKMPVHGADILATVGQKSQTDAGWEFAIPPQEKPQGNTVTFYASIKDSYLVGRSTLRLGANFYPDVVIQLAPMQPVDITGVVQAVDGKSVVGATVSVVGYADHVTTDQMGNFRLAAHAADGQMVTVRIKKGKAEAQFTIPAGKPFAATIGKQ